MKLLPYFFASSDSENESNDNGSSRRSSRAKSRGRLSKKNSITADTIDTILPDNGAETDEDVSVPKKVKKYAGSKIAKEVLSSSKNNFRAPILGTFNTSKFKKPFGIIDGFSTRFLHPANERDGTSRSSILKGEHSSALSNISNITINSNNNLSHLRNSGNSMSQSPVALDEFINISEFEEDDADVIESNKHWNPFKERSIPLSAFRNKGLINNYQIPDNSVNLRKYSNSNSMTNSFGSNSGGTDNNRRRSSFNHNSGNKIKRGSKSIRRNSQSQSMSPGPTKQQQQQQKIQKQKQTQQLSSSGTKRRNSVKHSAGDIDIEIPILDEELLRIASESALLSSSNKTTGSITPASKSTTRRPSMSSSKRGRQQERVRRQSMVEAAAEGLRSTRGGLFSEETLTGVEALLVDIGSTDDFSFLFNEN
ncbi:unnamed protein product [[Candida] boidinii]|nr:unnamed protein product [[Candida] boidinii]